MTERNNAMTKLQLNTLNAFVSLKERSGMVARVEHQAGHVGVMCADKTGVRTWYPLHSILDPINQLLCSPKTSRLL